MVEEQNQIARKKRKMRPAEPKEERQGALKCEGPRLHARRAGMHIITAWGVGRMIWQHLFKNLESHPLCSIVISGWIPQRGLRLSGRVFVGCLSPR